MKKLEGAENLDPGSNIPTFAKKDAKGAVRNSGKSEKRYSSNRGDLETAHITRRSLREVKI